MVFDPRNNKIKLEGGVNGTQMPFTLNQYYHIKIVKNGATNVKVYIDGEFLDEANLTAKSYSTFKFMKVWYGSGTSNIYMGIKNIQIKPL